MPTRLYTVLEDYRGKPSKEKVIKAGVYHETDPELMGLGRYLLDQGFAKMGEVNIDIRPANPNDQHWIETPPADGLKRYVLENEKTFGTVDNPPLESDEAGPPEDNAPPEPDEMDALNEAELAALAAEKAALAGQNAIMGSLNDSKPPEPRARRPAGSGSKTTGGAGSKTKKAGSGRKPAAPKPKAK